jgi:hypothetical protein
MNELPAEPILTGVFWTWIIPAVVFCVTLVATCLLYRHFSGRADEDDS